VVWLDRSCGRVCVCGCGEWAAGFLRARVRAPRPRAFGAFHRLLLLDG
jgi:hypothetical protein